MSLLDRVAGAPISWGICEVPGWGRELPRARVLSDMRSLGLRATELGPAGFLPRDPAEIRTTLGRYGLRPVAGFVPAVLHQAKGPDETMAALATEAACLSAAGADVLVVAASSSQDDGYEPRSALDDRQWAQLVDALEQLATVARDAGIALAVHPHVGTVIEGPGDVARVLDATDVDLCVDTGHLAIGGTDPVELVVRAPQRVRHVHLKDVDLALADEVRAGRVGYLDAVRQGLYRPLGRGDLDIAAAVAALEGAGYQHWYVLEQDVSLPPDQGHDGPDPADDVRLSLEFLREVERQLGTATDPHANETTARASETNWGTRAC